MPVGAFLSCLVLSGLVLIVLRRYGFLDIPNARSLHSNPTPRGGGVAPAVAGLGFLAAYRNDLSGLALGLGVASGGFALLGLVEDLRGLPVSVRLLSQAAVGAVAAAVLVWGPHSALKAVLLTIAVVVLMAYLNAFNFMDGINGISMFQVLVAGLGWVLAGRAVKLPVLSLSGITVASLALGFLPFNFPRARMFLGDVGSYFFGGWLGSTLLWAVVAGAPLESVAAPLSLYMADTGFTLVRRGIRRENLFESHKNHAYQRLVALGWSHARVAALVTGAMVVCTALGLVSAGESVGSRILADIAICLVLAAYLATPMLLGSRVNSSG